MPRPGLAPAAEPTAAGGCCRWPAAGPAPHRRSTITARPTMCARRARTQQLLDFAPGQESALYQLIDRDQITYIYLGPNSKPITAAAFPTNQGFEQVYAQGGVTIFAVHR